MKLTLLVFIIILTLFFQTTKSATFLPLNATAPCVYYLQNDIVKLTFSEAKFQCENLNSSLVMIKNKKQQDAIGDLARSLYSGTNMRFWIGLQSEGNSNEEDWRWLDGVSLKSPTIDGYPRWARGYPANDATRDRTYLMLYSGNKPNNNPNNLLYWVNFAENANKVGYICERQASGQPCDSSPCENGGTCSSVGCSYKCECSSFYDGRNCKDDIDDCVDHACAHGSCVDGLGNYTCNCEAGFTRKHCDEGVDDCINNACGNGECVDGMNSYKCKCDAGYTGEFCKENINDCVDHACIHGSCVDGLGEYTCNCEAGFTGNHCDTDIDDCINHDCINGRCIDGVNAFRCECDNEFTGATCEEAKFTSVGTCAYHLRNDTVELTFSEAKYQCESLNSSLVMIKNEEEQKAIGDLARSLYNGMNMRFWIGLQREGNSNEEDWRWLDGANLKSLPNKDYPRWARGYPVNDTTRDRTFLTLYSGTESNPDNLLYWVNFPGNEKKVGYICESSASGTSCDTSPCLNGGSCISVGCSYTCSCIDHYVGRNCTEKPAVLVHVQPDITITNNTFTLTCKFDGVPLPTVTWKTDKQFMLENSSTGISSFIQLTSLRIVNFTEESAVTSTLSMNVVGLCLEQINISCQGYNELGMDSYDFIVTPAPHTLHPDNLTKNTNNTFTFSFTANNEGSDDISCYFIIGKYHDKEMTSDSNSTPSLVSLEEMSKKDISNLQEGQEYIAVAFHLICGKHVNVTLGDNSESFCNIYNASSSTGKSYKRSKRDVDQGQFIGMNLPLKMGKFYSFYVITATIITGANATLSGSPMFYQSTPKIQKEPNANPENATLSMVIGIVVAVMVVALLLAALFIQKRRRRKRSTSLELITKRRRISRQEDSRRNTQNSASANDDAVYENFQPLLGNTSIALEEFVGFYHSLIDADNDVMETQFKSLSEATKKLDLKQDVAKRNDNRKHNRYKNILPYDYSRVTLNNQEEYINASYIDSCDKEKFFIATQGPVPQAVMVFWKMVWEKKCSVIIMLTKLTEQGKKKCEKYWPDPGESVNAGDLVVSGETEATYGCYTVRTFNMSGIYSNVEEDNSMIVTQIHFLRWPDHGVPVTTSGLLRLYSFMLLHEQREEERIIVHCSAGVGRTGTLIALDYLLKKMKSDSLVDVYAAVMNMRKQRTDMVQNVMQYLFLHKLLVEMHALGDTDLTTKEFVDKIADLDSWCSDEYDRLDMIRPLEQSRDFGKSSSNIDKNKSDDNIPYDHSRVLLTRASCDENTPYINASFVEGYGSEKSLIVAQGPTSSTVNEFWRAVAEYEVNVIVMLTPLAEGEEEMCVCYWPEYAGSTSKFGTIDVTLVEERKYSQSVVRKLSVAREDIKSVVNQIHYPDWTRHGAPPTLQDIIEVHKLCLNLCDETEEPSLLIHCSDGLKQTGAFSAFLNMVERFNAEKKIDVFRAVKDLRDMRPGIVCNLELYKLCYKLMGEYISSFDTYANFG